MMQSTTKSKFIHYSFRLAVLQACNGRYRQCLLRTVSVPTKRVIHQLPFKREQFNLGHGDVGARHTIATRKMYRGAAHVVCPPNVVVHNIRHEHGCRLIHAALAEAVILVDYYAVSDVFHVDRVEG